MNIFNTNNGFHACTDRNELKIKETVCNYLPLFEASLYKQLVLVSSSNECSWNMAM